MFKLKANASFEISAKNLNVINTHGFACVIAISDLDIVKKSRSTSEPTPDRLIGLRRISRRVVSLKHDYEKTIHNRQLKNGEFPTYEVVESKVSDPDPESINGIIRQGKKDSSKKYVRTFILIKSKIYEEYFITKYNEIINLTEQERADYLPLSQKESKKQAEHGLVGEEQVRVLEWKSSNILYLQKGKFVFNNLSKEIMKLFNLEEV